MHLHSHIIHMCSPSSVFSCPEQWILLESYGGFAETGGLYDAHCMMYVVRKES